VRRALALAAATPLLYACASTPAVQGSYTLDRGPVSYDVLKAATDKCKAEGGVIQLKSGYDERELSNYQCRIGGGK